MLWTVQRTLLSTRSLTIFVRQQAYSGILSHNMSPLTQSNARNPIHLVTFLINLFSIILLLYLPRYPVNITFQGAAAKLLLFFVSCLSSFSLCFLIFMSTSQNLLKQLFASGLVNI